MAQDKAIRRRNRSFIGVGLILIGILFALGQLTALGPIIGTLILPLLGLGFFAWGIGTRQAGLMIPGGIFTGLGLALVLVVGPFAGHQATGAIFMFGFAAGWLLITLVTAVFSDETQWWALIPGAVMGLVGAGLIGGERIWHALALIGRFWPVVLVLLGLFIIFRREPASP